jgi:hypothetical protein
VLGPGRNAGTQALAFDGVGSACNGGQHVSINGGTTFGGGALSVCTWVRYGSFNNQSPIIDFGNGSKDLILLYDIPLTLSFLSPLLKLACQFVLTYTVPLRESLQPYQ